MQVSSNLQKLLIMRFTQVFIFLCCMAFSLTALADRVYLEYSPDCMDVYEYHYNGNTGGKGHIVYHIPLNALEKVILEVGVEAKLNQPRKPSKTISCDDFAFNERMVRQINNGATQLYIVKKDGRGYNVSPVGIATYAQLNGNTMGLSSLDARFSFNFGQAANGINLATNGSESKVVYKGIISNSCPKSYLFEKTRERGGRSYASYIIVPELGVIEEKNGFNATDAENSVLRLVKINGTPYRRYIQQYCANPNAGTNKAFFVGGKFVGTQRKPSGKKPSLADLESGRATFGNHNNTTTNPTTTTTTTTTSEQPVTATCSVYKDLDRNMYMDWATGLPANTECGGNKYVNGRKVGETTTSTGTNVVTTTTTPTTAPPPPVITETSPPPTTNSNCNDVSTYGKHVVQKNETLYGISRLYGLTLAQIRSYNPGLNGTTIYPCMVINTTPKTSGEVSSNYKDKQHVVKRGETLYQLASRYGYTLDRFRRMNGIGKNEAIYPGQMLKTSDCNCPSDYSTADAMAYVPSEYDASTERITGGEPSTPVKRRFHVVKEDDTIYSISKRYNISVDRLRKLNDLEENEIIIPYQRIYLE